MFFFPDHLQVAWGRATRSLPVPTRSWTCSQRSFDWSLCTQHCLPRSATRSATASCFSQSTTRPSPGSGDQAAPRSRAGTAGTTDASGAEGSSKAGASGSQGGARNGELVFEAAKVEKRTTRSSTGRKSQEILFELLLVLIETAYIVASGIMHLEYRISTEFWVSSSLKLTWAGADTARLFFCAAFLARISEPMQSGSLILLLLSDWVSRIC